MEQYINNAPFALVIMFLIIGFVFLIKGADFFVEGSSSIAKKLKVPSIIIGLTIVAMGTSLPELVTSVVAAKKGENELALGNVVGSNIFNILMEKGNPKLAIRYAKRIIKDGQGRTPTEIAPGTRVYELVEELAKYLPEEMKQKII